MIRAVVFDLGQVLASPPELYEVTAATLGVSAADFEAHYWTGRPEYDAGGSNEDYWGGLLDNLGLERSDDQIAALAKLDSDLWIQLRDDSWQILRDVRAAGLTVAVLSNAGHPTKEAIDASPWRADIDHLFVSASMGVSKPEPEIFHRAEQVLGLDPHEIAFIDDLQTNVDGALAVGWQAHLWKDDADTRTWLENLGVL